MLKLVYDLKAGFEDEYIVLKNREFDLTQVLDINNEAAVDDLPDDELNLEDVRNVDEESFYEQYKDNIDDLEEDYTIRLDLTEIQKNISKKINKEDKTNND